MLNGANGNVSITVIKSVKCLLFFFLCVVVVAADNDGAADNIASQPTSQPAKATVSIHFAHSRTKKKKRKKMADSECSSKFTRLATVFYTAVCFVELLTCCYSSLLLLVLLLAACNKRDTRICNTHFGFALAIAVVADLSAQSEYCLTTFNTYCKSTQI